MRGVLPATAEERADGVVTVMVSPDDPPVVVPKGLSFAKPTSEKSGSFRGSGMVERPAAEVTRAKRGNLIVIAV